MTVTPAASRARILSCAVPLPPARADQLQRVASADQLQGVEPKDNPAIEPCEKDSIRCCALPLAPAELSGMRVGRQVRKLSPAVMHTTGSTGVLCDSESEQLPAPT